MILQPREPDKIYHPWFAWRWVRLNGPVEWDRTKRTGRPARWVWFRTVLRMRNKHNTYYRLAWDESE